MARFNPNTAHATPAQEQHMATTSANRAAKIGTAVKGRGGRKSGADPPPETPQSPSPPSPSTGGHRQLLEELRDWLREELTAARSGNPNMIPQLAGQYRATLDDLAKLDAAEPPAGIQDDLKAKRAERRRRQRSA